jgi:hypothetical protein
MLLLRSATSLYRKLRHRHRQTISTTLASQVTPDLRIPYGLQLTSCRYVKPRHCGLFVTKRNTGTPRQPRMIRNGPSMVSPSLSHRIGVVPALLESIRDG